MWRKMFQFYREIYFKSLSLYTNDTVSSVVSQPLLQCIEYQGQLLLFANKKEPFILQLHYYLRDTANYRKSKLGS